MVKDKVALTTMLGNYPNTEALKSGKLRSDLIDFDFADVKVANNFFKQIVRDAKFDVGELAIATYLQAKSYDKPYVLLPAVLVSRGQHHTIAYNPEKGDLKPSDLTGKRVGLRAYTVTTATWVRGILADEYGVDLNKVEWITFEDPHVAEYRDPPIVKRAPAGKDLAQMLLDGEIDAAVVGDKLPDPRLKHLIADHEAAAHDGPNSIAAFRSITWSSCVLSCPNRGPMSSRRFFACWSRARMRPAPRRTLNRSGSASRRAAPCSRPSSTIATNRGLFPPS
jgi:4,5-dihydroxyphthalate decarboxylase